MVGGTGIEPVTPSMSRAANAFSANHASEDERELRSNKLLQTNALEVRKLVLVCGRNNGFQSRNAGGCPTIVPDLATGNAPPPPPSPFDGVGAS